MKVIALVDGEHYPPVTRWGLDVARLDGYDVLAALFVGGAEKLDGSRAPDLDDVPVIASADDPSAALDAAVQELAPDAVLDLADEPAMDRPRRERLIATALRRGVAYLAPGARFDPPVTEPALSVPAIAVIGTGLRHAYPPRNASLQRRIAAKGAVISQFWPNTPPSRQNFPHRNVVMSGLALATIVVEATHTSGARSQARAALAHGRPVLLVAKLLDQRWAGELAARPGVYVIRSLPELGG